MPQTHGGGATPVKSVGHTGPEAQAHTAAPARDANDAPTTPKTDTTDKTHLSEDGRKAVDGKNLDHLDPNDPTVKDLQDQLKKLQDELKQLEAQKNQQNQQSDQGGGGSGQGGGAPASAPQQAGNQGNQNGPDGILIQDVMAVLNQRMQGGQNGALQKLQQDYNIYRGKLSPQVDQIVQATLAGSGGQAGSGAPHRSVDDYLTDSQKAALEEAHLLERVGVVRDTNQTALAWR